MSTLGTLAHGAPRIGLYGLSWTAIRRVAPIALVVALLVVSQTAATTRAFADQGGYQIDAGRDFLGVGVGNIVSGLFGSFPVNASPARTAAVASASGRTQAAGLGAAAALVLLVPASGLLKDVPLATLAAVLIFIATRIFHLRDLRAIARFDLIEFGLAVVTLMVVALVGVEQGIGVRGRAGDPRPHASERPTPAACHGTYPRHDQLGTAQRRKACGSGPGRARRALRDSALVRELRALPCPDGRGADARRGTLHLVVLDALGMSDIDYTGRGRCGR